MDNVIEIDNWDVVPKVKSTKDLFGFNSNSSYQDFFLNCLINNEPGIVTGVTESWPCKKKWLDCNKYLNSVYLAEKFGDMTVSVAQCHKKIYNVHEKRLMTVRDYVSYWTEVPRHEILYLKDWHFTKEVPGEQMYQVPKFFASDWLDEYYSNHPNFDDDYKFVYIGPKGSWTPLHVDVFTSYSWSVNVSGKKQWLLLRPDYEKKFRDHLGNLPFDYEFNIESSNGEVNKVTQESGEAIFVPSRWHHQVWNLEDTMSINHNWINGSNVSNMVASMQQCLIQVEKEIEDCRTMDNWDDHCQIMLKALYGMDFQQVFQFVTEIANSRMEAIKMRKVLALPNGWCQGLNYQLYDVEQASKVISVLKEKMCAVQTLDHSVDEACHRIHAFLDTFL